MTLKATKVRIYPSIEQQEFLTAQFGAVRFAWNRALAIKTHYYRRKGISLHPTHDLKKLLSAAKSSRKYAWLKDYDAMALQQACVNLTKAFTAFFEKRARYPRFKSRHGDQSSYHCTGAMGFGDDWIKIPKLGSKIRAKIHRKVEGKVKSITLSRSRSGKYFASILVEDGEIAPDLPKVLDAGRIRGIDAGVTDIMVDDLGRKTANPKHLKRAKNALRRAQKALSRKKKGSKNRSKARLRVARLHERVANSRADYHHKASRALVDESQAIIAETLNIKGMLKTHRLAGSIADAAWGGLLQKIAYKAARAGVIFHKIDRWEATSKTCSGCSHKLETMALSVRHWCCPLCEAEHDRDINAAINVRNTGILDLKASGLRV